MSRHLLDLLHMTIPALQRMLTFNACSKRPAADKAGDTVLARQGTAWVAPCCMFCQSDTGLRRERLQVSCVYSCSLRLLFGKTLDKALKIIDNPGPEGPPVLCFTGQRSRRRLFVVSPSVPVPGQPHAPPRPGDLVRSQARGSTCVSIGRNCRCAAKARTTSTSYFRSITVPAKHSSLTSSAGATHPS